MAKTAIGILSDIEHLTCSRKNDYALVCVVSESGIGGYEVGIADLNIKGYTPTGIKLEKERYDDAADLVDEANYILFPERPYFDNYKIELTSH